MRRCSHQFPLDAIHLLRPDLGAAPVVGLEFGNLEDRRSVLEELEALGFSDRREGVAVKIRPRLCLIARAGPSPDRSPSGRSYRAEEIRTRLVWARHTVAHGASRHRVSRESATTPKPLRKSISRVCWATQCAVSDDDHSEMRLISPHGEGIVFRPPRVAIITGSSCRPTPMPQQVCLVIPRRPSSSPLFRMLRNFLSGLSALQVGIAQEPRADNHLLGNVQYPKGTHP